MNVELETRVAALSRELEELREQQAATSDILRIISRSTIAGSPADIQPVLDVVAKSAALLCNAFDATIYLRGDDWLSVGAHCGPIPISTTGLPLARDVVTGRSVLDGSPVHIHDLTTAGDEFETGRQMAQSLGFRTILAVPLLRHGEAIGALMIRRTEARPFSDKQIELLETFADQAVIAIENVRLFEEVQASNREVTEALEQQTATAEVLKTISSSAFDLDAVLHTLVKSASDLCHAPMGCIYLRDGDVFRTAMQVGWTQEFLEYMIRTPMRPGRGSVSSRAALTGSVVQIPDVLADPEYTYLQGQQVGHFRTLLGVPLLRDGVVTGVFVLARPVVQPFSQREIELVKTFSDQAVIALENVRLFDEVQARTTDLSEALEQQTATADVLKVISRSTFDLQAVLQTLIDSAARLCGSKASGFFMRDGDVFRLAASYSNSPEYDEYERAHPLAVDRKSWVGRTALDKAIVHVPDVSKDLEHGFPEAASIGGYKSVLCVPLMREGSVIGVFGMSRPEVGPFSERQIELAQTLADQAVIAIENVRLFQELQARTHDLEEALQQQTATADVLKVISRSAFDLQSVLDALVASASRVCEADNCVIFRREGEFFRFAAHFGFSKEFEEYGRTHPHQLGRGSVTGRAAAEGRTIHVHDVLADPEYGATGYQLLGHYRTALGVPLLREGIPIGVFALSRSNVKPFTERQIELVQTFADQAVIAIENARLFEEVEARTADLGEALEQQTATADVLKVISRSAFDLQSVLDTLTESAIRLCRADKGCLERLIDGDFRYASTFGFPPGFRAYADAHPTQSGRGSAVGRAAAERRIIHIEDVLEDREYTYGEIAAVGAMRTVLAVPLLRQTELIGAFAMIRTEARPFTSREIELVKTFADQAVIAIENVRLFDQVQARTQELARSLEDLQTAQDRLIQTEKLASLGQLTAGIAHEIKNPMNFVNNFSSLSVELVDELRELLGRAPMDDKERGEIDELAALLKGNLDKIVQHGKRADSIVKNMLLHSRAGSGEHRPTGVNAVVEESLNLAYHGARAERKDFNITLERDLDPAAGEVDLYPQEITRVLLNLISNGFYATMKRAAQANGAYDPVLSASTKSLGDSVEIRIRDNGTGIPPDVKESMFNPFFTTKPAGEGTGLGLSLSHDIVVKQHAGTIEVDTEPGEFTEFRIVLPRGAATLGKGGGP